MPLVRPLLASASRSAMEGRAFPPQYAATWVGWFGVRGACKGRPNSLVRSDKHRSIHMRQSLMACALALVACSTNPGVQTQAMPPPATPDNPLLADWTGPYDGVPPWGEVRPALFPDAFQRA